MHTYLFPAQCCLPVCCVFLFDVIYLSGFGHVSVCVRAERRVEGVSCVIFTTLALIFRMRSAQLARAFCMKSRKNSNSSERTLASSLHRMSAPSTTSSQLVIFSMWMCVFVYVYGCLYVRVWVKYCTVVFAHSLKTLFRFTHKGVWMVDDHYCRARG